MASIAVTKKDRKLYPTYATAWRTVNGDAGAPAELLAWTVLRAFIIAPGLALGGVRGWKIVWGALGGSAMVSLFALARSYTTKNGLSGALPPPPRRRKKRK